MIGNDWDDYLKEEMAKTYFKNLIAFLNKEYQQKEIYPPKEKIFNALRYTSFSNVKVVILGQDPYHNPKEAEGLSFSVSNEVNKPPSLQNIFKELNDDLKISIHQSGSLKRWAAEGVLLLNSILTVESHKPASHHDIGWETFTDKIIEIISKNKEHIVFILWGNYAISKRNIIDDKKHLILTSSHPSPFSASKSFFGSKPFSKTNKYLLANKKSPINWEL